MRHFVSAGSRRKHPKCDRSSADQEHSTVKDSQRKKTSVFKVISFKRLSCPKSAKSFVADSCGPALKEGRDRTTKRGRRMWGSVMVCQGSLCYPVIFSSSTPPLFLGTRAPPPPALWQLMLQFTRLNMFLFHSEAASSHSLTLMSTILYQLHNSFS